VNPVTNKIYFSCGYFATVAVIDGATNAVRNVSVPNAGAIALNTITNKIYVIAGSGVTVIDGNTNATTSVTVPGTDMMSIAVNSVTNNIYVTDWTGKVWVIDGATNAITTVPAGYGAYIVEVNPVTNRIYVGNYCGTDNGSCGPGSVTVIDSATGATTTVASGSAPSSIAVNSVTNKTYVANGGVTVIDGATNATAVVAAGSGANGVAVNPVTNMVYVANSGNNNVTVISEQPVEPSPLTTTIAPLPEDTTFSSTPTFYFTTSSLFSPFAPPVQNVYYQVDSVQGVWLPASGLAPSFSGQLPTITPGLHVLYAWASDGTDATDLALGETLIGAVSAYSFTAAAQLTPTLTCPYAATPPLPDVAYSAGDVQVCVSDAQITYSNVTGAATASSDGYAVVLSPKLGVVTLVATVGGPGTDYTELTVKAAFKTTKGTPGITCSTMPDVQYSTTPIPLNICNGGDSKPLSYKVVSGPGKTSGVAGSQSLTTTGAGLITLKVTEGGDPDFLGAAAVQVTQNVTPAPLTITADSKTWIFGTEEPKFTATASGLVGTDKLKPAYVTYAAVLASDGTTPLAVTAPLGSYTVTPALSATVPVTFTTNYSPITYATGSTLTYQSNEAAGKIKSSPATGATIAFGKLSIACPCLEPMQSQPTGAAIALKTVLRGAANVTRTAAVKITNLSGAPVTFTPSITGDSSFTVNQLAGCVADRLTTTTLCTFAVTYAPVAVGPAQATTLTIQSSDAHFGPFVFHLTGAGK
jgi:DNA-binding beta-propeller fold protein YncE